MEFSQVEEALMRKKFAACAPETVVLAKTIVELAQK